MVTRSWLVCLPLLALATPARGEDADETVADSSHPYGVVRVISEIAEVRTGPGFGYRVVHIAPRGETLQAVARANRDYWFQVQLPDGTFGWVLGDQVLALNVDPSADAPPGFFARVADALFAPPPLLTGDVGISFSAGVMGGEGAVMFRPSVLLSPHLALEGFIGETAGQALDVIYYGATTNLFVWPSSPVTPFFAMGGGGTWVRKKADQFAITTDNLATANAGGGLLISFKKRVTLRFDFRNYVVFDANNTQNLREYSGGLAIYF